LWPILATLGWGLAVTFGVIAAIQRVELRDHHPPDPNSAEIVTAAATAVLAVAALIALAQVYAALAQVREARLNKNEQKRSEFSGRWDALRPVRRKVRIWVKAGGSEELRDKALDLRGSNSREYAELMTLLDFFEDLAISVDNHEIPFRIVDAFFGEAVTKYWHDWEPYVDKVRREGSPKANRFFEGLAKQIKNDDDGNGERAT
ncbi:hypothetical protein MNAB215_5844, partial [Mycobacterium numidiamassiliense]